MPFSLYVEQVDHALSGLVFTTSQDCSFSWASFFLGFFRPYTGNVLGEEGTAHQRLTKDRGSNLRPVHCGPKSHFSVALLRAPYFSFHQIADYYSNQHIRRQRSLCKRKDPESQVGWRCSRRSQSAILGASCRSEMQR